MQAAGLVHAASFATTRTPWSAEDVLNVGPLAIYSRSVHTRMVPVSMQTQIRKGINPKGILPKGGRAAKVRNGEMPKRQKWLKEEMRRSMWDRKEVLQVPHHHQRPIKSLLKR